MTDHSSLIAETVERQRSSIIGFLQQLIAQTQHGEAAVQAAIAQASSDMGAASNWLNTILVRSPWSRSSPARRP